MKKIYLFMTLFTILAILFTGCSKSNTKLNETSPAKNRNNPLVGEWEVDLLYNHTQEKIDEYELKTWSITFYPDGTFLRAVWRTGTYQVEDDNLILDQTSTGDHYEYTYDIASEDEQTKLTLTPTDKDANTNVFIKKDD